MESKYCIGVDLGGTNIAIGLVRLDIKSISKQISIKTNAPRPCEEISRDIYSICKKLCKMESISMSDVLWIGVATPGIVKNEVVISACNLGWENEPFGEVLAEITGKTVYVANDANAAAYAEDVWGSGKGKKSLVAITLGTGIGGGIVFHGRIWEGMNGFAAEIGHMMIELNGRQCTCGKRGCFETYCSATALIKDTKRLMEEYSDSVMWSDVGGDISKVNGATAFRAMEKGDKAAERAVNDFIDYLAHGVSNIINIFQPCVVCIGGGISREGEKLLQPLRERVSKLAFGVEGFRTELVAATFKNDAGIIGAALLGLQKRNYRGKNGKFSKSSSTAISH